jgi:hypothetical protein
VKKAPCAELAELRSAFVDGALNNTDRERLLSHLVERRLTFQYALSRSPAKTHTHRYGRGHSGGPRHLVLGPPAGSPVVAG